MKNEFEVLKKNNALDLFLFLFSFIIFSFLVIFFSIFLLAFSLNFLERLNQYQRDQK